MILLFDVVSKSGESGNSRGVGLLKYCRHKEKRKKKRKRKSEKGVIY